MTPDEIKKCIPDEVVEAVQSLLSMYYRDGEGNWISKEHASAALAAGLAAWPGLLHDHGFFYDEAENALILPLQETPNAK
jgi:hypothetical protein